VGIARALAGDPPIVLLDEPFSALDPISRERLQDEFLDLSRRLRKTFVIVTHDIFEAVKLGNRIGVMREGRLVQCGAPREIVETPADPEVAALLGKHRYQLRLMTITLGELCQPGADGKPARVPSRPSDGAGAAPAPGIGPECTAWEALDRMETERASFIRLEVPGAPARVVARQDLLGTLGA
jgi:osmoprotectant transport system ATP-binding protein